MKGFGFPEHFLVPWAAKHARPPGELEQRPAGGLPDRHARPRAECPIAELALDEDAKFLAIRADVIANMGAYLSQFSLFIPDHRRLAPA